MALTTSIFGYVSPTSALIGLVVVFILYRVGNRLVEVIKLRRLGERGHKVPSRLPFGLSFVFEAIKATQEHKNLELWTEILEKSGRWTTELRVVGERLIFTADPENIKAILATQFPDFGKGEPFHRDWKDFLGDSIFTTDGDLWHNSRQMLRPQFIKDRVSDLHCFEKHVQTLFKCIANGGALNGEEQVVDMPAGNGRPLEISDLFFRYTLDVATDFLLGKDVKSLTTPRQEFADAFNEVQRVQNLRVRAGPLQGLLPKKSFRAGMKVINEFITQYIDLALQLPPEELVTKSDAGYTFLHELAAHTRDRTVIRDQIVAVLLAGRDTTAGTLSWVLYELGRHPDVVVRLRREIADTLGPDAARTPTYADLKAMRYLQHVLSETLRLYPAVPFNMRMALRDTTLPRGGGPDGSRPLAVLKNTAIGYSALLMQRRADLYPPPSAASPDPRVFSPDRWAHWQPRPWLYIPFNGGPRICIGQQFALTEMSYVLVRLFQRFDRVVSYMDDVDGGHPTLKAEIVLQPGDGVKVALWEAAKSG